MLQRMYLTGSILLKVLPSVIYCYPALTDTTIRTARDAWFANMTTAEATYGPMGQWNTALVTNMTELFKDRSTFNGNVSRWDTRRVTTMVFMFWGASSFNGDLSSWNTSSVTNMDGMFYHASAFNGDVSTWDVSKVTNMQGLFDSTNFNGDVSSWNVSMVRNMIGMFIAANRFNGDVSSWDLSSALNIGGMFAWNSAFNRDLSSWDVSKVTNMYRMFYYATAFTQSLCWNSSKATKEEIFVGSSGRFSSIPYPLCLPTARPTRKPTMRPTKKPSRKPTRRPSVNPSSKPSSRPTIHPSDVPTVRPSHKPSVIPTPRPSYRPTTRPSVKPSIRFHVLESDLYGTPSPNASVVQDLCPDKSKIVQVNGRVATGISALYATCDDPSSTKLGPFGNETVGVPQVPLRKCAGGYSGWKVMVGSYIGQLTLNCSDTDMLGSVSDPIGAGLESGSRPMSASLSANQRIVGFRTYHNSSGIQAMIVLYADMSAYSDRDKDEGNGMLSFLYGILAFLVLATIAVCIMFYRHYRQ